MSVDRSGRVHAEIVKKGPHRKHIVIGIKGVEEATRKPSVDGKPSSYANDNSF